MPTSQSTQPRTAQTTVLSIVSTKGGVGKTTLAANLAGLLAALQFRVLAVDADMQPSLSKYYRLPQAPQTGLADVISRGGLVQPNDIVPTSQPGLDIIVSNLSEHTQAWLATREDRLYLLKRAIRQPVIRENYDFVVFDTQGASGEIQKASAMAADQMVSPLWPDVMEYVEFKDGTLKMLRDLDALADISPELRSGPLSIVINGLDRTRINRMIADQIRQDFRSYPGIRLLDAYIPDAKAYREARALSQPVHAIDLPRNDRVAASGYECMHRVLHELLPHLKGLWAGEAMDSVSPPAGRADASGGDQA
jgi:chromosome partitioning related protein ParA